jgi:hypothetical protein
MLFSPPNLMASASGLRISRTIVESHGSRLWASDNPPRGASLYFTLPSKRATRMTPAGAPPTVFVIDDEDDKVASALAKVAESVGPLGPPMHPPPAAISSGSFGDIKPPDFCLQRRSARHSAWRIATAKHSRSKHIKTNLTGIAEFWHFACNLPW